MLLHQEANEELHLFKTWLQWICSTFMSVIAVGQTCLFQMCLILLQTCPSCVYQHPEGSVSVAVVSLYVDDVCRARLPRWLDSGLVVVFLGACVHTSTICLSQKMVWPSAVLHDRWLKKGLSNTQEISFACWHKKPKSLLKCPLKLFPSSNIHRGCWQAYYILNDSGLRTN